MNAGIGDAVALGAALDAALARGSPEALDVYTAVRRPVAQQIIAVTNGLTRLAVMGPYLRPIRNVVLSVLSPIISQRLAWQLSGLVYRCR